MPFCLTAAPFSVNAPNPGAVVTTVYFVYGAAAGMFSKANLPCRSDCVVRPSAGIRIVAPATTGKPSGTIVVDVLFRPSRTSPVTREADAAATLERDDSGEMSTPARTNVVPNSRRANSLVMRNFSDSISARGAVLGSGQSPSRDQ